MIGCTILPRCLGYPSDSSRAMRQAGPGHGRRASARILPAPSPEPGGDARHRHRPPRARPRACGARREPDGYPRHQARPSLVCSRAGADIQAPEYTPPAMPWSYAYPPRSASGIRPARHGCTFYLAAVSTRHPRPRAVCRAALRRAGTPDRIATVGPWGVQWGGLGPAGAAAPCRTVRRRRRY